MNCLKLAAACLLLWTIPLPAQQHTVYQKVFSAITTNQASNPVANIGQIYHQITVRFGNQTGKTCVPAANVQDIGLEQSSDDVTYFRFGPRVGTPFSVTTTSYTALSAQGAWPYVRVNARSFDTTNCSVTVTYTGSTSPINPPQSVYNGYACTNQSPVTASGATGIQTAISANTAFVVDKLVIWNSGVAQTGSGIKISCGTTTVSSFQLENFPTQTGFSYTGDQPFLRCDDNTAINVTLAVAGNVDIFICDHYE